MCLGMLLSAGCVSVRSRLDEAVGMYETAADVGAGKLVKGPGIRSLMNEWQVRVRTPDNKYALVDNTGSRVKVLLPFDRTLHVFYSYVDNCYPTELRQSPDLRFLYLEIENSPLKGGEKNSVVLVYDLERREVIGRAAVAFRRAAAAADRPTTSR